MRTCDVPGCGSRHKARGLCESHYGRLRYLGLPGPVPTQPWFCVCSDPITSSIGECQSCHRKPRALMRVP